MHTTDTGASGTQVGYKLVSKPVPFIQHFIVLKECMSVMEELLLLLLLL